MDYIEEFIEFLENYKENGKLKYVEKIKKVSKRKKVKLVVHLADVYKYNYVLGIRLLNEIIGGKEELIPQILERLTNRLAMINPSISEVRLIIPNEISLLRKLKEGVQKREFHIIGYVAFIDKKKIGIIPPPEDIHDEKIYILIATLKDESQISVGDKISADVKYDKEFVIENVEIIEKSKEQITSKVKVWEIFLPNDYYKRIIKFIENFKDKHGKYKYREMIDKIIENNKGDLDISIYDLISFDKELGELVLEDPDNVFPRFMEVIEFYLQVRSALKNGLIPGAKLKGEKVILTRDFAKLLNLSMNELTYLVGSSTDNKKIVIGFGKFVEFLYKHSASSIELKS